LVWFEVLLGSPATPSILVLQERRLLHGLRISRDNRTGEGNSGGKAAGDGQTGRAKPSLHCTRIQNQEELIWRPI